MFLKNYNNTKLWKIKQKPKAKKKLPATRTHLAKPIRKKILNQNLSTSTSIQPKKKTLAQICFMKAFNYPLSRFLRRACCWWRTSKISTPKNIGVWSLALLAFFLFYSSFLYYLFSGFVFVLVGYLHVLCTWLFALVLCFGRFYAILESPP